ncbi:hypothetical protein IW262DRAFT_1298208 [Armillaria fumosa]|nr:hypothetical protein IW262DRAFT_1298208 [Armillaria fumosa]
MTDSLHHPAIEAVNNPLKERTFSQGRIQVSSEKLLLFYSKRQEEMAGTAYFLNFANASEDSLRDLCSACDAAGFGLGNQNTFDETYRKSKKLDTTQFSISLTSKTVYSKTIYSERDFFKAHKDTPRAENMMGSLVVIFPTPYEGGSLVLCQDGQEWAFSAEKMLAESTAEAPVISYVAFYSDVEHEVLPVTSGVWVTLTNNLYLEDKPIVPSLVSSTESPLIDHVKEALEGLLSASDFLPEGGMLGFGLHHQYPIAVSTGLGGQVDEIYGDPKHDREARPDYNNSYTREKEQFSQLVNFLKGSDASIFRACWALSLGPSPRIIYRPRGCGAVYMSPLPYRLIC